MRYFPLRASLKLSLVFACGLSCGWSVSGAAQSPAPEPTQSTTPNPVQGPVPTPVQSSTDNPYHLNRREIHPLPIKSPFPVNAHTGRRQELEFRAPEQMTAGDRELAEGAQMEIARRADLQGFRGVEGANRAEEETSKDGGWGYEQAVCPVFPEHMILEYSRGNTAGDVTLFAAVIPRGSEGHVRVIPVRRRGYSLWTPTSSNALTINDFNHMVKEGETGLSPDFHPNGVDLPLGTPDWLTLGLCYAALAGGHVRAALLPQAAAAESFPESAAAMLKVGKKAGAEVSFADATPGVKSMEWAMTFDRVGRLLKVKHTSSLQVRERPVAGAPIEVATKAAVAAGKAQ